jgi:hypothetical protein
LLFLISQQRDRIRTIFNYFRKGTEQCHTKL